MQTQDTFYQVMRRHGVTRRSFLKFCSLTATSLGLSSSMIPQIAYALENKPRTPVIWLHGLECTCCTESFIRSAHPLAKDAILSLISLDYDDTIMAAAGQQAEQALADVMREYKGNYIVAVEGNAPLNEDGMFCILAGEPFLEKLKRVSADAKAIIAWGSCASWGCVQAARPNPTKATPVHKLITDKPIIKVPGCPPIPEVMSAVITYMLAFDRIPPLDRLGRPKMFYGQRIHDKCYRRAHFDAGQFVEAWDDEGARKGYCLYKMGCKGPTTYNACSTVRWNDGVSFPIQSGHGCLGCSEDGFWDYGSFYSRATGIPQTWYTYGNGNNDKGLHPWDGLTEPQLVMGEHYKGTKTFIEQVDESAKYSWIKSPRWKGHAMEVGPLARYLIGYHQNKPEFKEPVDQLLSVLKLPKEALFSTLGRTAARALESVWAGNTLQYFFDRLMRNLKSGDTATANVTLWEPDTWPTSAKGVGFSEAPRGALGHWIKIENQRIDSYQCVVPTTWNAGPRDDKGQIGAYEAALMGTKLAVPDQPLEILRTLHSFDPCLACSTHVIDNHGGELVRVQVR